MAAIADVKKLDKYQIKMSLNRGDADFPYSLTDYHILMVPDGFKDWANPVGTGAFRSRNSIPGVRISLKKNARLLEGGPRPSRRRGDHRHQRRRRRASTR